jgi:hypothetical protein
MMRAERSKDESTPPIIIVDDFLGEWSVNATGLRKVTWPYG